MAARKFFGIMVIVVLVIGMGWLVPAGRVGAHCDTMDGPVVQAARAALEKGEVTPVLKWVKPPQEAEVREAFRKTLAVRALNEQARDLADRYFFETLVRLHREGEGAPYTGLKPAGAVEPVVAASDQAVETGSVDSLVQEMTRLVAEGIRHRFAETLEKKKHVGESVTAGREFVNAYVEFVHYVERLHTDAVGAAAHHDTTPAAEGAVHEH